MTISRGKFVAIFISPTFFHFPNRQGAIADCPRSGAQSESFASRR
ncbi:MAG: hypothetical protein AAGM45_19880 [Cyanobacteria bacterium J06588_5]